MSSALQEGKLVPGIANWQRNSSCWLSCRTAFTCLRVLINTWNDLQNCSVFPLLRVGPGKNENMQWESKPQSNQLVKVDFTSLLLYSLWVGIDIRSMYIITHWRDLKRCGCWGNSDQRIASFLKRRLAPSWRDPLYYTSMRACTQQCCSQGINFV